MESELLKGSEMELPDWQYSAELISEFLNCSVGFLERKNDGNSWFFLKENPKNFSDSNNHNLENLLKEVTNCFLDAPDKEMQFLFPEPSKGPYYIHVFSLNVVPARNLSLWLLTNNPSGFSQKERRLINQSIRILEQDFSSSGFFSGKGIQVSGGYYEDSERYRLIFENSPVGIFFYNTNLIITVANNKFCSILESPVQKIIGFDIKNISDLRVIPALLESLNGKEGSYEGQYHTTLNNKIINVLLKTTPVYNRYHEITGGIGIFQDITESYNAKKAQEESEMRFKLVAMHTNDVIFEWNGEDSRFQWHGNIKSIIGNDQKPLTLNDLLNKIHPDDRDLIKQAFRIDKRETQLWNDQFRILLSNGDLKYLKGSGIRGFSEKGYFGALGTITDITHEIELIQSLKEALIKAESNHVKAQSILSAIPDLYFVLNKNGEFKDYHAVNDSLLYIDPENFINKHVDKVLPPELAQLTLVKMSKVLSSQLMETYTYVLTLNGNERIFESRMVPYMKDLVISIVRDVTKSKTIEKELLKAKEKAEESDQLKSSFLANMSHEIRTPLNGIMGFAELLQNEDNLPENRNFYLDLILKSGQQLLGVINDVLEISKIETGQLTLYQTEVNLKELLKSLLTIFEIRAKEKNIHLKTSTPLNYKPFILKTDLQKLTQVFYNLLGNAVKFTRVNGSIRFGFKEENKTFCFFVQDTGIGIDAKDHHLIFDRFRQADSDQRADKSGSGLGLSISKSLVELMGGRIWVESEPEKGSTFFFTHPRNQ